MFQECKLENSSWKKKLNITETVDSTLPIQIRNYLKIVAQVAMTLVMISYATPMFLVAAAPLCILYYVIQVCDLSRNTTWYIGMLPLHATTYPRPVRAFNTLTKTLSGF